MSIVKGYVGLADGSVVRQYSVAHMQHLLFSQGGIVKIAIGVGVSMFSSYLPASLKHYFAFNETAANNKPSANWQDDVVAQSQERTTLDDQQENAVNQENIMEKNVENPQPKALKKVFAIESGQPQPDNFAVSAIVEQKNTEAKGGSNLEPSVGVVHVSNLSKEGEYNNFGKGGNPEPEVKDESHSETPTPTLTDEGEDEHLDFSKNVEDEKDESESENTADGSTVPPTEAPSDGSTVPPTTEKPKEEQQPQQEQKLYAGKFASVDELFEHHGGAPGQVGPNDTPLNQEQMHKFYADLLDF